MIYGHLMPLFTLGAPLPPPLAMAIPIALPVIDVEDDEVFEVAPVVIEVVGVEIEEVIEIDDDDEDIENGIDLVIFLGTQVLPCCAIKGTIRATCRDS